MKRFVIIGLGNFGAGAAESLYEQGFEVIAVDLDADKVQRAARLSTRAVVADGGDVEVLRSIGAERADGAVVSTGDDIDASLLALLALRDVGVANVYVKVVSLAHTRIVQKLGATEAVFPEREASLNLAARLARGQRLRNYIRLGHGFSLQEMPVPRDWMGRTLRELALPTAHRVSVVAIHDMVEDRLITVPDADVPLRDGFSLILTGAEADLTRIAALRIGADVRGGA